MKPRGIWISSLALCLVLTACAPAASTPTRTPGPVASATSPVSATPTAEAIGDGVPVIEFTNGDNLLTVISSVTGRTLEGLQRIPLGTYYAYAFSQDGHTLAVTSAAQLYLIDTSSWTSRVSDVGLHGSISAVVYSPDGSLLALASGGPEGYLRIANARSGAVEASGIAGFTIRDVRFTQDGKALMVYGPQLASNGIAANAGVSVGSPKAALFAASDLSLLWSVDLAGVRDGTFPKKADTANTQEMYQPGAAWHFEPGIAFAPGRDVLYAVHGDADQLTTVDFATKRVKTAGIHPHLGWFDQLLSLTAGVAYAKGMDGTIKQAIISPDGKYLYVVGSTEAVTQQPDQQWNITNAPFGLEVIATEDGALVAKVETDASSAMLSSDGRQLLLSGWKATGNYGTPWTDVYELSSNSLIKHLDDKNVFPTRRLDGKAILASTHEVSADRCDIAVLDSATWSPIGKWSDNPCPGWLTSP